MTKELYEQVKNEIPDHIGVYIGDYCAKRSKKQSLSVDEQILKDSMIRSLYREAEKVIKSDNPTEVEKEKKWKIYYKKEMEAYKHKYFELMRIGQEKFGSRWYKETGYM